MRNIVRALEPAQSAPKTAAASHLARPVSPATDADTESRRSHDVHTTDAERQQPKLN